ncbi:MAG: secondary thiamine-phosphate synthase enzyme YjbQ, partial [Gemmatimonadota bacterium]|nr:secondary thiamine-phosphate synthase enzyme YjbQ [Gemmatimonadota bacterium]
MRTIELRTTRREELVDITREVERRITEAGLDDGVCVLWSTHTTSGLTVNEGADPAVARDIEEWLTSAAPRSGRYRHLEGNADSHIKTTLVGPGLTLLVSGGRLQLGRWQRVFFCEFDGPRTRNVLLQLLASA